MIIRCLIYVASFEFIFKSVHSSFTATKHAQALSQRNEGAADKVSLTLWSDQFLQMEPRGTKDNIVHKQNPCAKSESCKHNFPPDQCPTVGKANAMHQDHAHTNVHTHTE